MSRLLRYSVALAGARAPNYALYCAGRAGPDKSS